MSVPIIQDTEPNNIKKFPVLGKDSTDRLLGVVDRTMDRKSSTDHLQTTYWLIIKSFLPSNDTLCCLINPWDVSYSFCKTSINRLE